jgi:hypothetical protein
VSCQHPNLYAADNICRSYQSVTPSTVYHLKHTFGRRLRAAGVSFEDRQDLLGHKSGRITTHYSQAELENLIAAANRVCGDEYRKSPALVILKKKRHLEVVAKNAVISGA